MIMDKPVRPVEFAVKIGSNSKREVARVLKQLTNEILGGGEFTWGWQARQEAQHD